MPNLITHIWFGKEVLKKMDKDLANKILEHKDAFILGNLGPDYMYAIREIGFPTRSYPNSLHHNYTCATFESIAKYLREKDNPIAFSYAMGMLCHYVADKNLHPFVNALCEGYVGVTLDGKAHPYAHGFIESAVDTHIITERMGVSNPNKYFPNKDMRSSLKTRRTIGKMFGECVDELHGYKIKPWQASLSFQITRLFLWFANDPHGIRHPLVRKMEDAFMGGGMQVTALMRPPIEYDKVDYLNFAHRSYRAVRDEDALVNYDAMQIIDSAIEEVISDYIPEFYSAIKDGSPLTKSKYDVNYEGVRAGNF
ncbi:MAG: zinc dependent phospholipase C family protein [Clostridia bacterium]|nr:zinc dependent phospholipase C family protein [Clostridia bacterium]